MVSARAEAPLREQAGRLATHLADHPDIALLDAGSTLAARARFEHRALFFTADRDEAVQTLPAMAEGAPVPNVTRGSVSPQVLDGKLAVMFTGQGGQRPGMGRRLYATHPVFARALDESKCLSFTSRCRITLRMGRSQASRTDVITSSLSRRRVRNPVRDRIWTMAGP